MEHSDTFPINRDKLGEIMGKKRLRSPGKSIWRYFCLVRNYPSTRDSTMCS